MPGWLELHPFLAHYQSARTDGSCAPRGTTGRWHAASGSSGGPEHGSSISPAWQAASARLDQLCERRERRGPTVLFVDDIVVSTGRGQHVVRGRRLDAGRLESAGLASGSPPNRTTGSSAAPDTPTPRGGSQRTPWPARTRSSTSSPVSSARTRSTSRAGSSTTTIASGSRSRTRPGRSTRRTSSTTRSRRRRGRRARARAPVVRRQPRGSCLAAHLAQRGLRDVRRAGSGASTTASRPRRRSSTTSTASPPTIRSGR